MGEWVTAAAINLLGSIGINFGTNLLKLGHNQTACTLSLGLGQDQIHASSVLVMPMVPSRMTGFRVNALSALNLYPVANSSWLNNFTKNDDMEMPDVSALPVNSSHNCK